MKPADTPTTDSQAVETLTTQPKITPAQVQQFLAQMHRMHGAKCRTKGFKDHVHQPSGNKLSRKLERQGSLYRRVSIVTDAFNTIQLRNFKDKKDAASAAV